MFGLRKRTWIIGASIAALIGTGAIASRYHNPSVEDRADFATYMITKKLELNDSQEKSLDELAKSWVNSATTMKSFRKSMLEEVKKLAAGESLTIEQINVLREKLKSEIDKRADQIIPQFVAFYNELDAGQKEKIASRLDKISDRMDRGGFRWNRRHHGKGPDRD